MGVQITRCSVRIMGRSRFIFAWKPCLYGGGLLGTRQMSIIERPLKLAGSRGEKEVVGIFDSGSSHSCIKPELAQKTGGSP